MSLMHLMLNLDAFPTVLFPPFRLGEGGWVRKDVISVSTDFYQLGDLPYVQCGIQVILNMQLMVMGHISHDMLGYVVWTNRHMVDLAFSIMTSRGRVCATLRKRSEGIAKARNGTGITVYNISIWYANGGTGGMKSPSINAPSRSPLQTIASSRQCQV